jgi:hypothetical protein
MSSIVTVVSVAGYVERDGQLVRLMVLYTRMDVEELGEELEEDVIDEPEEDSLLVSVEEKLVKLEDSLDEDGDEGVSVEEGNRLVQDDNKREEKRTRVANCFLNIA